MKRQIMKSLMALCAGVMTLCAASSLFVSCEGYDDSELRGQISQLDERVKNLENLKTQLEALTARVDALYTLKFQVADNNELQYSFDGGKTWTSTGIVLAEQCEHECPPCQYVPCDHECPEVSLVDNGDSVTIKVGDAEFTIEKPEEIMFEIRAGKLYFESEATMTVGIKSSGIEDITVMAAPKGWWAEINSDGLVEITAPNYEDTQAELDYETREEIPAKYAASGYVKVHACGVDGKCMVGKVPVEVVEQALVVKAYAGQAYFNIAGSYTWAPTFYYGISTKESLEADTKVLIDALNADDWAVYENFDQNWGEPAVLTTVEELLGEEPKVGTEYVVWALLHDYSTVSFSTEDLVLAYYSPVEVKISEVEAEKTAYNVTVNVEVNGADSYVAVAMPELYCDDVEYQKEQMVMALAEGQYYGKLYTESYSGSALDIAAGTTFSMTGQYAPNSSLYVFILPLDGRPAEDYTAADVTYAQFSTAALTAGGSIDLTAKQVTSYMGQVYDYEIWDYVTKEIVLDRYTQLGVEVTPSATSDWTAFYFTWMDEFTYADYGAYEEDLVDYILENSYGNTPSELKSWPYYSIEKVAPNTTMHFVAFIVDAAGKYGKIAHVEATSDELEKADFVWTEPFETNLVDGVLKNTTTLKFTPKFEGGVEAASYKYVLAQTKYYNQYEGMDDAQMAEELFFSTASSVVTVNADELVNGVLYVEGNSYGYPYYFAIVPIDAEGRPGPSAAILEYESVFALDEAVTEGAAFEATKPQITLNLPPVEEFYPDGGWGDAAYYGYEYQSYYDKYHFYYEIGFAVAPAEGTEVKAQYVDTQSYTLGADAATRAGQLWSESLGFGCVTTTEPIESSYKYLSHYQDEPAPAVVLCVSWKDAEGTVYYMDIDVQPELQKLADRMTRMINGESEPVELSVDGKQWLFSWDAMGVPGMLDLGVSAEGYFYLAYDATASGMEGYVEYIGSEYSVTPTDETSGVITLVTYNMYGEPITMDIAYSGLTETSCSFVNTDVMLCDLEGNPVVATVSDEVLPVTPNGVAM